MGWWEELTSWFDFREKVKKAVGEIIDYIKDLLWGWVDDIARFWVERANQFFDILNHGWEEFVDMVEGAKSYADDIVTDAILKIDTWINEIGRTPELIWENLKPFADAFVAGIRDTVDLINNVKIPSLEDITNWAKEQLDNILNWDIPLLNQSILDLWGEANKIWQFLWSVSDDVWNVLREGWEGMMRYLTGRGEAFVEYLLNIDLPLDDVLEELREEFCESERRKEEGKR
ncbi:hypothetical protein DRP04_08395 [Archaeoglobales archaeon]|nr:MAG: hypothetical protein DRP04_08395 [Archaeoglobales archaeon]